MKSGFFLDSIDEARLNRRSFDRALTRFAHDLGALLDRARVLVSCRASDWKGADDRVSIESILAGSPRVVAPALPEDPDAALLSPIFAVEANIEQGPVRSSGTETTELLVVQLVHLSEGQRRLLAGVSGVTDPDAFVRAINQQGLDALSDRPGDILDLAAYWRTRGKFGTLSEMTEHGVNTKLIELDKYRPDNEVLSLQQARQGAERLAAALTLGKSFTLVAPGHVPDPTLAPGALDPVRILDDWTDAQRNTLTRRGIFAPSTYGRIRFHHRGTQEYLVASWLHRLLLAGCPVNKIMALLFTDRYGVETVVPSLRPVAAWLALRHAEVRDELVCREPLALLGHGDPGSLPFETKKGLLISLAHRHAAGEVSDDSVDRRALWMFASPELADTIRSAWHINPSKDFHAQLLRLIGFARIEQCTDLAEAVAASEDEHDFHRILALDALKECEAENALGQVAATLMLAPGRASARLASEFATVLFPRWLSTTQLLTLIDEARPSAERPPHGFAYVIERLWDVCTSPTMRVDLMQGLADLCTGSAHRDDDRLSGKHAGLVEHLGPVARGAVQEFSSEGTSEATVKALVRFLGVIERGDLRVAVEGDPQPSLNELVRRNTRLQRMLFWHDVGNQRSAGGGPTRLWQVHAGGSPLWALGPTDVEWLLDDLAKGHLESDRRVVLSAVVLILRGQKLLRKHGREIRRRCRGNPILINDLQEHLARPRRNRRRGHPRNNVAKVQALRLKREEEAKTSWLAFRQGLQSDPRMLADRRDLTGDAGIARLRSLVLWLWQRAPGDRGRAIRQWQLLEEAFGRAVAEAYRDGMKLFWRLTEPETPQRHENGSVTTKWSTVLACGGVGIESEEDGGWVKALSPDDARRAALHGCLGRQGYPDWIDALVDAHPTVLPIVEDAVRAEWSAAWIGGRDFLDRYAGAVASVPAAIRAKILQVMRESEAGTLSTLENGIRAVRGASLTESERDGFGEVARRRFRDYVDTKSDWAIRYIALLFVVDASSAIGVLTVWLQGVRSTEQTDRAVAAFGALFGHRAPLASEALSSASVTDLEALVVLSFRTVRVEDDNVHDGGYTPNDRDEAETARGVVFGALRNTSGADAYAAMMRLSTHPDLQVRPNWLREVARGMAERDSETQSWAEGEVLAFERLHTLPMRTGDDLFRALHRNL